MGQVFDDGSQMLLMNQWCEQAMLTMVFQSSCSAQDDILDKC